MKKKLIVISHDAMVFEDLDYLKGKPTFQYFMENGSQVQKLRTIYPTITYPVHVSIITGTYPNRHGVINNEIPTIGELSAPWHWFAPAVKTPTLFEEAKKAGLTTAAVFWPVSGNDPNIDYLVDEYWSQSQDDDIEDVFRRSGSSEEVMEKVVIKNLPLAIGNERKHPEYDEFIISCACDIIRSFKPDLLVVHPAAIDGARHQSGLFTEIVTESLDNTERWTRMIVEATKDAGVFEDTDFVLMSDHGQLDIKRVIHPNVILRDHGLIRPDEKEEFADWDAFCKSAAMSAQVYLKDPSNQEIYDKTYKLLCDMCREGIYGISEVFTKEEINEKEHLDGDFSFVIETDGYTAFGNDWRRPLVYPFDISDYRFGRATHGYLPGKGPQPTLIASGPSFKKGAVVEGRPIVDIAPTLAKLFGISLESADGTSIDEILR